MLVFVGFWLLLLAGICARVWTLRREQDELTEIEARRRIIGTDRKE